MFGWLRFICFSRHTTKKFRDSLLSEIAERAAVFQRA